MIGGADGPALVLDHVQLAAPPGCEPAARRLYGGVLGLTEIHKPTALRVRAGVWFAVGDGRGLALTACGKRRTIGERVAGIATGPTGPTGRGSEKIVHIRTSFPSLRSAR